MNGAFPRTRARCGPEDPGLGVTTIGDLVTSTLLTVREMRGWIGARRHRPEPDSAEADPFPQSS